MNTTDIANAKNPDLRASAAALRRAAEMARQIAIQTNTDLIVVRDGKLVSISPQALREAAANGAGNTK